MYGQIACINGEVVPSDKAVVSVYDDGLLRGDGVYEVVRLYQGSPFALDDHIDRLQRSAAGLRLPFDESLVRADVREILARAVGVDCCLRIVLTSGGARVLLLEALASQPVFRLSVERHQPTPLLAEIKSLSYAAHMRGTRLAKERGFDDVLLVTPDGVILESATASVFWVENDSLFTPPLSDGILDSITRRKVLALWDCREETSRVTRLKSASEVFIASTRVEITAVTEIESIGSFETGDVTKSVAGEFRRQVARELDLDQSPLR